MTSTDRRSRRVAAKLAGGLTIAMLAAGALAHPPAAPADTKAPDKPAPVTCIGGGTVGQEIEVTVTTTLPNGQKGRSTTKATCGADGQWHINTRTAPPTTWHNLSAATKAPVRSAAR